MADEKPGLLETILLEAAGALGATVEMIYDGGSGVSERLKGYIAEKVEKGLLTAEEAMRLYDEYQERRREGDMPPKPYIPQGNNVTADQIRAKMKEIEERSKRLKQDRI